MSANSGASHHLLDEFVKSLEAEEMAGENDELSKSASMIRCQLKQPQVQELAELVKKQNWEGVARAMQLHFPTTNAANHRVLVEHVLVCLGERPLGAIEWVQQLQPEFQPGAWDAIYEHLQPEVEDDSALLSLQKHLRVGGGRGRAHAHSDGRSLPTHSGSCGGSNQSERVQLPLLSAQL